MNKLRLFKEAVYPTLDIKREAELLIDKLTTELQNTAEYHKISVHQNKSKLNRLEALYAKTLSSAFILLRSLPSLRADYANWTASGGKDRDKFELIRMDFAILNKISKDGLLMGVGPENPDLYDIKTEVDNRVSEFRDYNAIYNILKQFVSDNLRES